MDLNRQKEQFSIAYAKAVISASGFNVSIFDVDEESVDLIVAAYGMDGSERSPRLEMQLKCTADQESLKDEALHFALNLKNYNDLRETELRVPKILVVLLVPQDPDEWIFQDEKALLMRRCAYWLSLRGFPEVDNTASRTVEIPRSQAFNVKALKAIMHRISEGGEP